MRRVSLSAGVLLLAIGCTEPPSDPPFEGGRYAFDGTPPVHVRDIATITLEPIPEGPTPPVFVRDPHSVEFVRQEFDLEELLPYVPDPLPATLDQGDCEFGGNLVVTTNDGAAIAYGPCRRPRSIYHVWWHFSDITSDGACRPFCGPGEPGGT